MITPKIYGYGKNIHWWLLTRWCLNAGNRHAFNQRRDSVAYECKGEGIPCPTTKITVRPKIQKNARPPQNHNPKVAIRQTKNAIQ